MNSSSGRDNIKAVLSDSDSDDDSIQDVAAVKIEENEPTAAERLKYQNDRKAMTKSLVPGAIEALRNIPKIIGASEEDNDYINNLLDKVSEKFDYLTKDIELHYDKPQYEEFNVVPNKTIETPV